MTQLRLEWALLTEYEAYQSCKSEEQLCKLYIFIEAVSL